MAKKFAVITDKRKMNFRENIGFFCITFVVQWLGKKTEKANEEDRIPFRCMNRMNLKEEKL